MKRTSGLILFTLFSSIAFGQIQKEDFLDQLDTCKDGSAVNTWLETMSRSNLIEHPEISHLAFNLAESRIDEEDSVSYARMIREHAIMHAIREEPDSGLILFQLALEYTDKNDSTQVGYAYRNIGVQLDLLERVNEALDADYLALRYLPLDDSLFRPLTYLELAKHLYKVSNFQMSVAYAEKAAEYFEISERWFDYASSMNVKGISLMEGDFREEAIVSINKSLSINKAINNVRATAQNTINLGIAHHQAGHTDSALYFLRLAEEREDFNKLYSVRDRGNILSNMASIHFELGDIDKAREYAKRAYVMIDSIQYRYVEQHLLETLYQISLYDGDSLGAITQLEKYIKLYRDNISISNNSQLQTIEQDVNERNRIREYNLLKREVDLNEAKHKHESNILYAGLGILLVLIFLLLQLYMLVRKRRKETAISLEKLNELDMAKNRLFSIIGHDLRGPIGNSLFLLKEIPQRGDQLTPDTQAVLENVEHGLTEVHGLLENLLIWARDQAKDLEWRKSTVNISAIVEQCSHLLEVFIPTKNMKITTNVPENLEWNVDANAYGTIIRNLVSNALKYGPEESTVTCNIRVENNLLITRICDEGPGLPPEVYTELEHLDTLKGANRGMGLKLVKLITLEHQGTIHFHNEPGQFCVEVRIPK